MSLKESLKENMTWEDENLNPVTDYEKADRLIISKSMFEEIFKEVREE